MLELLYLVGAIMLVVLVQTLRGILAMPFPRLRIEAIAEPPAPVREALGAALAEAAALGFGDPVWLQHHRVDGKPALSPHWVALRHASLGSRLWLAPPVNAQRAHWPQAYFTDRLRDGRIALSQAFDLFFVEAQHAGLVARVGGEPTLAAHWQTHQAWVLALGPMQEDAEPAASAQQQLIDGAHAALLAAGRLQPLSADVAVPRFAYALHLLAALRRLPKPPPAQQPFSPGQLALLARSQEQVQEHSPPKPAQWALFLFSVVLFMALGALIWSPWLALAILLVVLVHELGHFLAMRAFGYRNVHMLALPLVGGVAIGHDVNPAATRRAWMSLMGPLPGILIGWGLLAAVFLGTAPQLNDMLWPLALLFLAINYLNVLPVPPLDGAHVVESLLPARWARLQVVLLAGCAVLGAALAWYFDFILLTVLALWQLLGIRARWRLLGIARRLADDPGFRALRHDDQVQAVLNRLQRSLGPTSLAALRIQQALGVVQHLAMQPMGAWSRLLTATVYLGLLAGPLAAGWIAWQLQADGERAEAQHVRSQTVREGLAVQAGTRSLAELLADLGDGARLPPPATEAALALAGERLGAVLPEALQALYRTANGVPALDLAPVEQLVVADAALQRDSEYSDGVLLIDLGDGDWAEVPVAEASGWWQLGEHQDGLLLFLPQAHPRLPGIRVIDYQYESPVAYPSLQAWLQASWVVAEETRQQLAEQGRRGRALRESLRPLDLAGLLAEHPRPDLLARLQGQPSALPDPADSADLARAAQRIGASLPEALQTLYRLHDGFPPLQLLPAAQIDRWEAVAARLPAATREALFAPQPEATWAAAWSEAEAIADWREASVEGCVVVAARQVGGDPGWMYPLLAWCPDGRWIDIVHGARQPDLRAWVREHAVRWRLAGEA